MTGPASARIAFETARLHLARNLGSGDTTLEQAYARATRISAEALSMARVGIWHFEEGDQRLLCLCLYTAATQLQTRGDVLDARLFPTYVSALRERRAIAVKDARSHPVTRELTDTYLNVHGIASLLDAPIIVDGKVIGVVCHEHVGAPREFEQRELDFAASVADMVALAEVQARRVALEVTLREHEELLQRSAKLEAVSRLARSAAHDFNNLLGVVMVSADVLTRHADPAVVDAGRTMLEAAHLGARVAQDLLVVGRDEPATPTKVALGPIVNSVGSLLRTRFQERVDVTVDAAVPGAVVLADPSQLERVVMNLGVNAAEAIPERGAVVLRVREPMPDEISGRGWVALEVTDTGIGMSHEVRSHLFEPYFTTKAKGHGLGLASVYGIVRQLKGRVLVSSEPGRGTTVVVILPIAA